MLMVSTFPKIPIPTIKVGSTSFRDNGFYVPHRAVTTFCYTITSSIYRCFSRRSNLRPTSIATLLPHPFLIFRHHRADQPATQNFRTRDCRFVFALGRCYFLRQQHSPLSKYSGLRWTTVMAKVAWHAVGIDRVTLLLQLSNEGSRD